VAAGEGGSAASARAEAPPARPRFFSAPPIDRAVEATPPERDRVVDAARAAALLVVVLGHGVMAVAAWPDGVPRLGNLLAAFPWTQGLTWVLQIMPLFFWAGGAANAMSWRGRRAGTTYAGWIWSRGRRLLRPVIVYLVVMGIVATVVTVLAPRRWPSPSWR
jgi:fucose 4-O-acetylase-like acetyltransferase